MQHSIKKHNSKSPSKLHMNYLAYIKPQTKKLLKIYKNDWSWRKKGKGVFVGVVRGGIAGYIVQIWFRRYNIVYLRETTGTEKLFEI